MGLWQEYHRYDAHCILVGVLVIVTLTTYTPYSFLSCKVTLFPLYLPLILWAGT